MDFRALTEANCGQANSFVQLAQHVTQDFARQESVGLPITSRLEKNSLMPPQSFNMNDLMDEIQIIESQSVSPWLSENQTQYESICAEKNASQAYMSSNYASYQNVTSFGYEFPQSFPEYFIPLYPQNGYQPIQVNISPIVNQQSQESVEFSEEFIDGVVIESLDELKDLEETEENCETLNEGESKENSGTLKEGESKQSSETFNEDESNENTDQEVFEPIKEFENPRKFFKYLKIQAKMDRDQKGKKKPEVRMLSKRCIIEDTKSYSFIKDNKYRKCSNPYAKGIAAMDNNPWKAALYFDEAARQDNKKAKNWMELSYALVLSKKYADAFLAIKEHIKLVPGSYRGNLLACFLYNFFGCKYQAVQSIFNWFKYNPAYNFLIPVDFEMNAKSEKYDINTTQLEAVKQLFLKAAQLNPRKVDAGLQIMISEVLEFSSEYHKVVDCLRSALKADPTLDIEWVNLGYTLFYDLNKPYEAIDAYLKAAEFDEHISDANLGLALIHMYLKNYREAIRYFKNVLLEKGENYQIKENTLEEEYNLCLRMFIEIDNKNRDLS